MSLLYYVEPVTGFMLIDSLFSDEPGAFSSAVQHLILPAIVLAPCTAGRGTADALGHARGAERRIMSGRRAPRACAAGVISLHALRSALIQVSGDRPAGHAVCRCDPD